MVDLSCAIYVFAQQSPTIKVPVRLVAVPTLVFSQTGDLLTGLDAASFHLTDNGHSQHFRFESISAPVSLVLAIQSSEAVRDYLPVISKAASTIENSLLGANGQGAVLSYDSEVTLLKAFSGTGDLESAIRKVKPGNEPAHLIDAGLNAIQLLKTCPPANTKLLIFIGQPYDSGSSAKFATLTAAAERENATIFALALPLSGKTFVSDTFHLGGRLGGYVVGVELTKLGPALKRTAKIAAKSDPFALLTTQTGGLELHFRKQKDLENAVIALGAALHTTYTLTYSPDPLTPGYHAISVTTNIPGAIAHARAGYQIDLPQ